jgi:hypothetical protein
MNLGKPGDGKPWGKNQTKKSRLSRFFCCIPTDLRALSSRDYNLSLRIFPMKHDYFKEYEVSGFETDGGWRLHVRHEEAPETQSHFYVDGRFYQGSVDLPPNPMNEVQISQLTQATPVAGAEQAMLAAILEWKSNAPKPKRA